MIRNFLEAFLIGFGFHFLNVPIVTVQLSDEEEWSEFHEDAYVEYFDAFTQLFNEMEYKRSKNNRSMVRRPGDKSFKFVAAA